jgi:hypothetical protein
MKVRNVHERRFRATDPVGGLIDSLASPADALWPIESWPRIVFDRPLQIGAVGGHGPIRYVVEAYQPGKSVRFRFTGPKGFNGSHGYEVAAIGPETIVLRHVLEMTTSGLAILSWPLMYRPLHDALIEDSLATAQASLGYPPTVQPWSAWVKFLRWLVSRGRARLQVTPNNPMQRTAEGRR